MENYAYLSCSGNYSEFDFNHYDTTGAVEEYIDLVPMLKNLFIDPEDFLKQIKEVRLKNA